MKNVLLYSLPFVLVTACTSLDSKDKSIRDNENSLSRNAAPPPVSSSYKLKWPSEVYPLPAALQEISGLAVINENTAACVQDEEGTIFIMNLATGKIDKEIPFAGKGDFEEIALVGNAAYIMESTGAIYHVADYMKSGQPQVNRMETGLDKKNNAEGLCYDEKNNRLLISCKGKGEENEKNKKAIYAFDLKTRKLSSEPVMRITQEEIRSAVTRVAPVRTGKRLDKALRSDEIDDLFTPSGLAVHPRTGELYVLSTQNNLLAILDMQGNVNEVFPLTHELFTQPEGISFTNSGDMYISNEGKKRIGNILKFSYEKK